jgi:hydrogenase-4 component E
MNIEQPDLYTQALLFIAALISLTSFLMLGQGRLLRMVFIFSAQGVLLTLATVIAAISMDNHHLLISAFMTLLLKVILIPWMLKRQIVDLKLDRHVAALNNKISIMMGGAALVVFSYYVLQPVLQGNHLVILNALATSLSVVLLGMLLMISHRQAIAHVVGFMSIENGLFFAAIVSTNGMPMVVELGVAFDVLVAAILFGIFFLHISTSIESLDVDMLNRLHEVDK